MALHAQMEGFNSLQNEKCVERRYAGAGVAQTLYASLQYKSQVGERRGIGEPVIGRIGLDKVAKASGLGPVELTAVDNDTADAVAVAAQEFCSGVEDDIRTPLNWAA